MAVGVGSLITSVLGSGSSSNGTSKTNTKGTVATNNKGLTLNNQTGKTVNTGKTSTVGKTTQQQVAASGGTSTTVGTADKGALATAKGLTATALSDSTNDAQVKDLINSTVNQAAIAFAPTGNQGRDAGVYNSSSEDLLSGYAQGQASADASAAVLNYKQGEQGIAENANASVLDATKGSTGTAANTSTTSGSGTTDSTTANIDTSQTHDQSQLTNWLNSLTQTKGSSNTANQSSGDSGGVFSSLSLVCAEMLRQDKMELRLWVMINRHFIDKVGSLGKIGYWTWAHPVAKFARAKPDHWFTAAMFWLTEERACYVAAKFLGKQKYSVTWKGFVAYQTIFYFSYATAITTSPIRWAYVAYWNRFIKGRAV